MPNKTDEELLRDNEMKTQAALIENARRLGKVAADLTKAESEARTL
jgi:inactivated superfamily I helicase